MMVLRTCEGPDFAPAMAAGGGSRRAGTGRLQGGERDTTPQKGAASGERRGKTASFSCFSSLLLGIDPCTRASQVATLPARLFRDLNSPPSPHTEVFCAETSPHTSISSLSPNFSPRTIWRWAPKLSWLACQGPIAPRPRWRRLETLPRLVGSTAGSSSRT